MQLNAAISGISALTVHLVRRLLLSRKVVIAILIALFVAVIMGYAGAQDLDTLNEGASLMDVLILFFFMPVIAMIFGTSLIRDEIDDRSITHIATSPLDRAYVYVGYYIPLVIAVVVSMLVVETAGFIAFFSQQGFSSEAGEMYLEFMGLIAIGAFVYSSLFLAVSVLFKKPVFFGLFYAFIWEGFVGSLPGAIQKASIKHYLRSVGSEWVDYGEMHLFEDASGAGYSAIVLIVLAVVLLVLGAYLFREKELS